MKSTTIKPFVNKWLESPLEQAEAAGKQRLEQ